MGKELELVREVERYRQDIVRLASMHSLGSATQLIERGWTLHFTGVARGEQRTGAGLLTAPQLSHHVLNVLQIEANVIYDICYDIFNQYNHKYLHSTHDLREKASGIVVF